MADTLDVLTIEEAHEIVNLSSVQVDSDSLLAGMVTLVSRALDSKCGAIVQRTKVEYASGGSSRIFLRDPIVSIASIVEWSSLTSSATLTEEEFGVAGTASDFRIDRRMPQAPILVRRSGGADYRWACGDGNIIVTFEAGRYATTEDVAAHFKTAAQLSLKNVFDSSSAFWQRQANFGDLGAAPGAPLPGWLVPRLALEGLVDELLPPGLA